MTGSTITDRDATVVVGRGPAAPSTTWGDSDEMSETTASMSLPGLRLLRGAPAGGPVAAVRAVRAADDLPVQVLLVTADLAPAELKRVRAECAHLEALLDDVDPDLVLPLLDHGVDGAGRPYLVVPRPGPGLDEVVAASGPLPPTEVVAAARVLAGGLAALAGHGLVGPPPALCRTGDGGFVLATPLPPVLAELAAALGEGTGHEPPEVLSGGDWTSAGQVYACAAQLWTLLAGQPPYGSGTQRLSRLLGAGPPRLARPDVPEAMVEVLRRALAVEPGDRPDSPAALAEALAATLGPVETLSPAALDEATLARPLGSQYLLDTEIGRGATGHVWAGRRRADGSPVAVKLLRSDLAEDPEVKARFLREHATLTRLRHPHLVGVHDLVAEGGALGIVMDLVQGVDLRRLVVQTRLSTGAAATLLAQTAQALAAVHAAGIVHRDVKPENVLATPVGAGWSARLTDFGIARAVAGSSATALIGTPAYLAPELATGHPPAPPADVYALGVTGYELLAGHRPFHATSIEAWMRAHLEEAPPRPAGVDDAAWKLLAACLAKDPAARPTAAQVAAGWAALVGNESPLPPVSDVELSTADELGTELAAKPLPVRPPDGSPRKRRRLRWVAVGVVTALGAALGVYLATPRSTPEDAVSPSPSLPATNQYPVAASARVDRSGAVTLTWSANPAKMDGFRAYLVMEIVGDSPRWASDSLGADVTSYRVVGRDSGDKPCYRVIAFGVTEQPPDPPPPLTCPFE
jgi:serine/threonine protein kinase